MTELRRSNSQLSMLIPDLERRAVYSPGAGATTQERLLPEPQNFGVKSREFSNLTGSVLDLALIAMFSLSTLFLDLGDLPVTLWDESRNANNAIEMNQSGFSFVTTYLGNADLWNTKPPLMIWLIALSFEIFGVSEWSLRLPSALASLATAGLVYHFCRSVAGSRVAGVGAALILLTTYGYVAPHVARTGDFDALLVLFTTTLAIGSYAIIARLRKHEELPLPLVGFTVLGLTGAILTKGIAGLLVVPGIVAAAMLRGVILQALGSRRLWGALCVSIAIAATYYCVREVIAPGYLAAVSANELGSRFSSPLEGHQEHPLFYVIGLLIPWGGQRTDLYLASAFPWSWIALLLLPVRAYDDRCQSALSYIAIVLTGFLLVISVAQTKISWYVAPAYPLLACFIAIKASALLSGAKRSAIPAKAGASIAVVAIAGLLFAMLATRIVARHRADVANAHLHPELAVSAFLHTVSEESPSARVRVLAGPPAERPPSIPGREQYTPQENFYAAAARSRGVDAQVVTFDSKLEQQDLWIRCGPGGPEASTDQIVKSVGNCRAGVVTGGAR